PSLIPSDRHIALTGYDQGRAAARGAASRSFRIVRIENRAGIGGVATARETQVLTDCFPDNLSARIQNASYNRRVHIRNVALQDIGPIHHRYSGAANVVLYGYLLACKGTGLCALDRALPVPSIEPVFRGGRTVTGIPPVPDGQRWLGELVQPTIGCQHAVNQIAERRQIILIQLQSVRSCDSLQFAERWFAQDTRSG